MEQDFTHNNNTQHTHFQEKKCMGDGKRGRSRSLHGEQGGQETETITLSNHTHIRRKQKKQTKPNPTQKSAVCPYLPLRSFAATDERAAPIQPQCTDNVSCRVCLAKRPLTPKAWIRTPASIEIGMRSTTGDGGSLFPPKKRSYEHAARQFHGLAPFLPESCSSRSRKLGGGRPNVRNRPSVFSNTTPSIDLAVFPARSNH